MVIVLSKARDDLSALATELDIGAERNCMDKKRTQYSAAVVSLINQCRRVLYK